MKKCIICDSDIPEGRQVCQRCEELLSPFAEILKAMFEKKPVEFEGMKYGCISAVTIRTRGSHHHALPAPIIQAELMSRIRYSVAIVDPKKIKIL